MDAAAIEQTLREFFARAPHGAAAVYLFGSQARGTARDRSDVDVGVLFEEDPPRVLDDPANRLDAELDSASFATASCFWKRTNQSAFASKCRRGTNTGIFCRCCGSAGE